MPFITRPLTPRTRPSAQVAEVHKELVALGLPIANAERKAKRFGRETAAAVKSIQKRYGLPETGSVDPATGRVMHVASLFASSDDRTVLRTAIRKAVPAATAAQPQELYWLARYAILAGDYGTAHDIALRIPDHAGIRGMVAPLLELPDRPLSEAPPGSRPPRGPEVPFPENFYTYRYDLVPQRILDELLGRTATGNSELRMAPSPRGQEGGGSNRPLEGPEPPPDPPDDPAIPLNERRVAAVTAAAYSWLQAVDHWRMGHDHFNHRRYAHAVAEYDASQRAALRYFEKFYEMNTGVGPLPQRVRSFLTLLHNRAEEWSYLWENIQRRRICQALSELHDLDWPWFSYSAEDLLRLYQGGDTIEDDSRRMNRQRLLDYPQLLLATIFVPLAKAEANRARRQYIAAQADLSIVLTPFLIRAPGGPIATFHRVSLTCDFIERPFVQLLKAEILLDQADAEYKARTIVDPTRDEDVKRLTEGSQRDEFKNIVASPGLSDSVPPFQMLQAAVTYFDLIKLFEPALPGSYLANVQDAVINLNAGLTDVLKPDTEEISSTTLDTIGKGITIPTIKSASETNQLPGLDRSVGSHESLLSFSLPNTGTNNPRVYSLLLAAFGKLIQLWHGFNYLGYRDDYVPPWRFPFLLERARYFAEHAKNDQREYLNFLSNAEREEFQELTTAQNVEMEKSNIRIESAKVDQVRLEIEAAQESANSAKLSQDNARTRYKDYKEFDAEMDSLEAASMFGSFISGVMSVAVTSVVNPAAGAAAFVGFMGDTLRSGAETGKADLQRALELRNLGLAITEAEQSAKVAQANLSATVAGMVVAGLQRQAALLRHEFAIQNLNFLRNRTLNSEQWYRLVAGIRIVSETYLRYAVALGFLAEQAYEFEADKRINVIRFDYDISELGDMLAADFLLRDLDTLEQDLIVGQRLRQQQVRYTLSLGREFPEALQNLRDDNKMTFSLQLEQLERRFPGLYNLRITSVEVLPVALMDPTRFSLELTYLGSGQVRLKEQPGFPTDPAENDWLGASGNDWPMIVRVTEPETAIFSGLTRQDLASLPAFVIANQRGAFEGLPGASAWEVNMSMKENRVVPGTLADIFITFTLAGYYESSLRQAIDQAPRKATATTTWFSAQRSFPDAFFQFNRSGRMDWNITPSFLSLSGVPDAIRNVSLLLQPAQTRPALGRLMCSYPVEFDVTSSGEINVVTTLPRRVRLETQGLNLQAQTDLPFGTIASWDFGDGTGLTDSNGLTHTYTKPGRYEVTLRLAANSRFFEYRVVVVVSRSQNNLLPPLIAVPDWQVTREEGKIVVSPSIASSTSESFSVIWRMDNKPPDRGSNPETFTLDLPTPSEKTKRHVLQFAAVRPLKGRVYSRQRYLPDQEPIALTGLHLSTNRTFEVGTDDETTANRNPFTRHLFGTNPDPLTLSPIDRWTLELPLEENPAVMSVSSTDVLQHDLSELSDAILTMEYQVRET